MTKPRASVYAFTVVALALAAFVLTDAVMHVTSILDGSTMPVFHHIVMTPILLAFGVTCVTTAKVMYDERVDGE